MLQTRERPRPMQRLGHRLLRLLMRPLLRFQNVDPEDPKALIERARAPVVYVLPVSAASDRIALSHFCRRYALPSPDSDESACIALFDAKHYRYRRGFVDRSTDLDTLIKALKTHDMKPGAPNACVPGFHIPGDASLVPVTLFWGRAPQKSRVGGRYLLTGDAGSLTGRIKRLAAVVLNGRALEVRLGEPLSLSALLRQESGEEAFARLRVTRFLRRYFHRVRLQAIGPNLSHRQTMIDRVLGQPAVVAAVQEAAKAPGQSREKVQKQAERYGHEIAANMSVTVMRLLYQLLNRLWNRLYDGVEVHDIEAVEALAGTHELVYVPCHRSHIDYLLLSWVLYQKGLMPPHIAAGRNLNMPLIGPLLRGAGAFFMRRSFRNDPLYAAVFNEYLHQLLSRGHPVEYFIEGGRSRTGRMLPPRPGMLSMTLRSHARTPERELAFVPVYIGYEKVLESGAYMRELRTGQKRKESPLALLRALRHLRQPFGHVQVSIGEPLVLGRYLDEKLPDWRRQNDAGCNDWLRPGVAALGLELSSRINRAAALTPSSLVALTLLAAPHRTLEIELLARQLHTLVALQRQRPGGDRVRLPAGEPADWIERGRHLGLITRVPHPLGDLMTVNDEGAPRLTWYRNNVLHLFALHALVAFAFRHNARLDTDTLEALLAPLWPALCQEFFIDETAEPFKTRLVGVLESLAAEGLLFAEPLQVSAEAALPEHDAPKAQWQRPEAGGEALEQLTLLGGAIQPTLERGFILLSTLMRAPSGTFSREALETQSQLLAERLTRLQGLDAPEFFDARLFAGLLDSLERDGWLWQHEDCIEFDQRLPKALYSRRLLFDPALRRRLTALTAGHSHSVND